MKIGGPRFFQRSVLLAVVGILVAVLTACTGKGGGYLPPGPYVSDPSIDPAVIDKFGNTSFTGQAPFGFTFSCEDKGGLNPPTGQLAIELAYSDQGTSALNAPFSIHGIVDKIDPVLESMICIGSNPPSPPNELIFLGRYRPTSSSKPGALKDCPSRETTSPLCRFEVFVRDNDGNLKPSKGDFFSIQLSSATAVTSDLDPTTVFYARAGYLAGGNLTVK
jgi:predicted small lipoprotein YifL